MDVTSASCACFSIGADGIEAKGLAVDKPLELERLPGPIPGTWGMRSLGGGELALRLDRPLAERGSVAFWLRSPMAIRNGADCTGGGTTFLELPGLWKIHVWWYSGYCQINFHLEGEDRPVHEIQLPGIPGPQWFHLCLAWDGAKGLFQVYVNGTPTRLPGTRMKSRSPGSSETAVLPLQAWAMSDLRFYEAPLDEAAAESLAPPLYRGALDALIGAQPRGELDADRWRGDLLYENDLSTEAAVAGWRMEGPGIADCRDGWMHMESTEPDSEGPSGHIVHWCDRDFPADFLAEFETQPETELGLMILFFCARGSHGEDLFDPALKERTGIFGHYTNSDIDCYHVSYYANTPDAGQGRCTSNLRKNPGFYLVDQGPIGIPPRSRDVHRIAVLKQGRRIEVAVDGRRLLRWFDPDGCYGPVHGAGKIGFRQMKWMQARYRNFCVYALPQGS